VFISSLTPFFFQAYWATARTDFFSCFLLLFSAVLLTCYFAFSTAVYLLFWCSQHSLLLAAIA
jgi:hypothetical protein